MVMVMLDRSEMVMLLGLTGNLVWEEYVNVNQKFEFSFLVLTIPVFCVTVGLNFSVILRIWKKDKTLVNQLMKLECCVNIFYSLQGTDMENIFQN